MFTESFDSYVCFGDTITTEADGFTITATVHHDPDMGPPWKEHDGHGPVSEWRSSRDKRAGERVLYYDGRCYRFYDWQEAITIAKRDKWGFLPHELVIERDATDHEPHEACGGRATAGPFTAYDKDNFNRAIEDVYSQHRATMTAGQYAAAAVERDFQALRAWCRDEWSWGYISLSVSKNGVTLEEHAASLSGIEVNYPGSDNAYLLEVANELLPEALEVARAALDDLRLLLAV